MALSAVEGQCPGERGEQPKNGHALAMLRRVHSRLSGSDGPQSGKAPVNVAQQVEWIIHQATSVDQLSAMYEGWAPWV